MKYDFPMILPVAIDRIIKKILIWYYIVCNYIVCSAWGIVYGRGTRFTGKLIVRTRRKGSVEIGEKCKFNSCLKMNLVGLMNPTIIDTMNGGCIKIGNNSGFSSVVLSSRKEIIIGSRVLIGGNVRVFDHDFHSLNHALRGTPLERSNIRSKRVVIDDDVFIGTNAIILKGTQIGARSIIAAGSVVMGLNIPPDSMVKGNPACVVSVKTVD